MLSRAIINALFPEGKFWQPKSGDDYDKLLDGIGANSDAVLSDLEKLANIRDPDLTPVLDDLEKEYGIVPAVGATDAQRRSRLKAFTYQRTSSGTWEFLQQKLRDAGFDDVYVHPNDPAVDPDIFLAQDFNMTCGGLLPSGNPPQCGEAEAMCASVGGELLVNGDLMTSVPNYSNQCGIPGLGCEDTVCCGDFDGYKSTENDADYTVPATSGYWPLIFFVGGVATRDPVTGELTEIMIYSVPNERRIEFRRVILKFKPLHSWAALIVVYS